MLCAFVQREELKTPLFKSQKDEKEKTRQHEYRRNGDSPET